MIITLTTATLFFTSLSKRFKTFLMHTKELLPYLVFSSNLLKSVNFYQQIHICNLSHVQSISGPNRFLSSFFLTIKLHIESPFIVTTPLYQTG